MRNPKRWQQTAMRFFASAALMLALISCGLTRGLLPDRQPAPPAAPAPQNDQNPNSSPAALPTLSPPAASDQTPSGGAAAPPAAVSAATPAVLPSAGGGPAPVQQGGAPPAGGGVRDVARQVSPTVVQITNQQVQLDQFDQPFSVPAGVGSGVIYDNQGYILTNNHVIEGAQQLLVSLPDGRSAPARLVGADPQTDLAVIQINGDNLPVAQLGSSSQLQVGDWVVAIGNALALPGGPTVTVGVVSALGRSVQEPGNGNGNAVGPFLFDVIQTSAPINPGNSGGPLVNLQGQVVGINTLVAGQAEPGVQAQGIGFAIAIDTAKPIADELVRTGRVVHPSLGISYVPLTPAIAAQLGIQQTQGIVIGQTVPGGPAAQAGLRRGDVVTAIDNTPLKQEADLARLISRQRPGDQVTLTVQRGSQTSNVQVTLGQMQGQ